MNRVTIIALAALLGMTGCTIEVRDSDGPSLEHPRPDSAIEGTLVDETPAAQGSAFEGQILIWRANSSEASETTGVTMFGRPLEALAVIDHEFSVSLDPGWYRVRGTARGGQVCGEVRIEVRPHRNARVDFTCA
jgi:hypothetical protein